MLTLKRFLSVSVLPAVFVVVGAGLVAKPQVVRGQYAPVVPPWHDPHWPAPGWGYPTANPWLAPPPGYVVPVPVPVPVPSPLPRSVRIASEVIPDPPLAPAHVELVNSTRDPLRVEIIDLRRGELISRHDIDPASSLAVTLPRHSGGQAIETYRTYGPSGDVTDSQVTRRIPPKVRYEVAVHRWQMQSIAIDRTGKSPSPIEDIQFAGQGVGRFRLPQGEQLVDGRIDVYLAATAAANPDSVAPIFPSDVPLQRHDPLHEALQSIPR